MNKKIVFFDVDGTLYLPEIGVPDSAKEAIAMLIDNGHIPIICTGRTRPIIPDNLIELGFQGIIAGAGTYIEYDGKVIENHVVEEGLVNEIMTFLQKNKVRYILEGPEYLYYEKKDQGEEYSYITSLFKFFGEDVLKAIDPETTNKIFNSIKKVLDSVYFYENQPIILVSPKIRAPFRRLIEMVFQSVNVLSLNEIPNDVEIKTEGVISI